MKLKVLSLVLLVSIMFTGCLETGKGSKIGQVVKVNEASGVFCKTVEVEIVRGGFNNGSGAMGGSLHFTIENNKQDLELVKKAMVEGSEIEVYFTTEFNSFCRSDSNSTFSNSIKVLNNITNTNNNVDYKTEIINALKLQNEALQKLLNQ